MTDNNENLTDRLLDAIKTPADLRRYEPPQLAALAEEIRQLIKNTVSRTGGHLASNLGVVELTIALHYVFDFDRDRLVWDVGHQCYVHKILTGRTQRFATLRQADGISGFPNPAESAYDPFAVGHAGTAVATALGLALGMQHQGQDHKVAAVVGDASIVNGLSFEGLNNTSLLKRQLLIVLNDNSMAIDKTQGAFARHLAHLKLLRPLEDLHRRTKLLVSQLPYLGDAIKDTLHRIKDGLKTTLHGGQMFEQFGLAYFGPIDGHDIGALIKLLTALKEVDHPVLLHVQTEKGRGFTPAHEDPCTFHSPSPFEVNGEQASFTQTPGKTFTAAFADALARLMHNDNRLIALTAAMPDGTGLAQLRRRFPDRIIDVGIAESAAVDIAAGMAKTGLRPIVAIYSTFLQRSFDQIFQEVALQNLPVIFCIDRAGLVGGDGAVHQGFCDITLLRTLPNMVLMAPMSEPELAAALAFAADAEGPCAIRYPRDRVPPSQLLPDGHACPPFELGKAVWLRTGQDAVVIAYGSVAFDAFLAAEKLADDGLDIGVVSARFAKPLDEQLLNQITAEDLHYPIITIEDHALAGGFGSALLEWAQQHQRDTRRFVRLGMPDRFIQQNSRQGQLAQVGLDADSIAALLGKLLQRPASAPQSSAAWAKKAPTGA